MRREIGLADATAGIDPRPQHEAGVIGAGRFIEARHLTERRETGPLFRFSPTIAYQAGFSAVALGIARAMLDSFLKLAGEKTPSGQNIMLRDGGTTWFVDYQGLRLGMAEYDLASLLFDPYVTLTDSERDEEEEDLRRRGGRGQAWGRAAVCVCKMEAKGRRSRSPHARARFVLGDLEPLRRRLAAVLTAADVPFNGYGIYPDIKDQPVLADGQVRYRGEAVVEGLAPSRITETEGGQGERRERDDGGAADNRRSGLAAQEIDGCAKQHGPDDNQGETVRNGIVGELQWRALGSGSKFDPFDPQQQQRRPEH